MRGPFCLTALALKSYSTNRPGCVVAEPSRLMKYQCSHLDALACWRISRRCRIRERAVRGEARPPIRFGIQAFEQQRFIGLHLRHIEPSMRRNVAHLVGLADTLRINEVRGTRSSKLTVLASQTASGESLNGPRIGRHRLMIWARPRNSSSASSGSKSRTRC